MSTVIMSSLRAMLRRLGVPLRPQTLAEISVTELRRDRIGHQQTISTLNRQIETIEANKDALLQKGIASPSDSFRRDVARHLPIMDLDIDGKNRALRLLFKELEAITGLLIIKENQEVIRKNGLTSVIARMNLDQLTQFVHEATVEGELQWDKLTTLCGTLNDSRQIGSETNQTTAAERDYFLAMQTASNANLANEVPVNSTRKPLAETQITSR